MSRLDSAKNVLGTRLEPCSTNPLTGFYRDGCCNTGPDDGGAHVVCVVVSADFLAFSKAAGNDLSTPAPEFGFAGLKPGDRWCLCATRWREAKAAGRAPKLALESTHEEMLRYVDKTDLLAHGIKQ